jgi:prepilin peptidase CpaA
VEVFVFLSYDQLLLVLCATLTGSAAISDLRTGLIPNRLVLCFALLIVCLRGVGVVTGLVAPATLLDDALYGALFAACVPLLLYVCGGLGGGDLKLLVVCGAALGPLAAAHLQLYAFALGSALALLRLTYRGELLRTLWRSARVIHGRRRHAAEPRDVVRFAPAVSLATLMVLVERW